jgi:hypothetical protein
MKGFCESKGRNRSSHFSDKNSVLGLLSKKLQNFTK